VLVKDVMTPNPITIDPNQPVLEALLVMYQRDIRRLPVMEGGKLVGIISDRDIKQTMGRPALVSRQAGEEPELKLSIRDVMTQNLITVSQDDDLKDAIELLVENKISGLPVVDQDQKLVGVISAIDVLRYCLDLLDRFERR
jgi:acetoin utilization protein AcuB